MTSTSTRAPRLPADERRDMIVAALAPYVLENGTDVSTRDLAAVAGVAEGTLFRVFADKKALVAAVVVEAARQHFQTSHDELPHAVREGSLRDRLVALVTEMSTRAGEGFRVVSLLHEIDPASLPEGVTIPGPHDRGGPGREEFAARRQELVNRVCEVLGADLDRLRLPVDQFFDVLRSLAFGRYLPPHASIESLTPEQIVDLVLHGVFDVPADPAD